MGMDAFFSLVDQLDEQEQKSSRKRKKKGTDVQPDEDTVEFDEEGLTRPIR